MVIMPRKIKRKIKNCLKPIIGNLAYPHYKEVIPLLEDTERLNAQILHTRKLAESADMPKKFHIIRSGEYGVGLFSYVGYFMFGSLYALANGMVPVFDMQSLPSIYLPSNKLGKENAWEYYFNQPFCYSLSDVHKGRHKHKKSHPTITIRNMVKVPPKFYHGQQQLNPYWKILYDNLFYLNDKTKEYIENEYQRIIKPGMRVLGVYCRGTDYTKARPKNHSIQPEVSDVIAKVQSVLKEWNCDYIYITSEEKRTVEEFEKVFPGRVLAVKQQYYDDVNLDFTRQNIGQATFDRENDAYLKGLEYLTSVVVFSRCSCAILGVCSGSVAALYLNGGKYENTYIYNLGKY